MANTSNRMQAHWNETKDFIKREWPALTERDLEKIDGEYDRLVETLKKIHGGASLISQEAHIKDKINHFVGSLTIPD